jgi:glycosyltransferase involved in cell wall biosynthesis
MGDVVVIPTYNEAANIERLARAILALDLGLDVIVVDDNSPDGTGDIVESMGGESEHIRVIRRPGKMGLGTAHIAGFREALAGDARHIITMDADFSHHPSYIPQLLTAVGEYDMVIGSRYVSGGGTRGCTWPRRLLSWGANAFAKMALGLTANDCTAGFRCYRRAVLEAMDLDGVFSDGYSFLIELLYRCQRLGFRVGEVPITFENRQRGTSKISRQEVLRANYTVLRLAGERMLSAGSSSARRREA